MLLNIPMTRNMLLAATCTRWTMLCGWIFNELMNILLAVRMQLVVQYTSEYQARHSYVADN